MEERAAAILQQTLKLVPTAELLHLLWAYVMARVEPPFTSPLMPLTVGLLVLMQPPSF